MQSSQLSCILCKSLTHNTSKLTQYLVCTYKFLSVHFKEYILLQLYLRGGYGVSKGIIKHICIMKMWQNCNVQKVVCKQTWLVPVLILSKKEIRGLLSKRGSLACTRKILELSTCKFYFECDNEWDWCGNEWETVHMATKSVPKCKAWTT